MAIIDLRVRVSQDLHRWKASLSNTPPFGVGPTPEKALAHLFEALAVEAHLAEREGRRFPYGTPVLLGDGPSDPPSESPQASPGVRPVEEASCPCRVCLDAWDEAKGNVGLPTRCTRMIVCPTCGNKRCPHATHHVHPCTGSNEPGQKGSDYE